jgi:Gpi18-like mannosyltransferase
VSIGRGSSTSDAQAGALRTWVASRVSLVVVTIATSWMVAETTAGSVRSFTSAWDHWDTGLFVKVARFGYQGYPRHYPDRGIVAFFPGEPLALRAVHLVVRNWVASGLLISAVAGAVACVALVRLGAADHSPATGERAVLYLVLSPYAVFLAAAYSEALFLAFALPAWLMARRGRWPAAAALAALAAAVRVTGLFLAVALIVQWLAEPQHRRRVTDALSLLLPFLPLVLYAIYLHHITGDWLAWPHAQRDYWGRHLVWPWTALHTTWHAAFAQSQPAAFAWSFRAEIVAVFVGVAVCVVLVLRRRWGELTYVGLQVVALATSSFYLSVARTALLWWPLWLLLAEAALARRWLHSAYLAVAAPLMVVGVIAFQQGHWVG